MTAPQINFDPSKTNYSRLTTGQSPWNNPGISIVFVGTTVTAVRIKPASFWLWSLNFNQHAINHPWYTYKCVISAPLAVSSKFETVCKQIYRTLPLSATGGPSRYPTSKLSPLVVSVVVSQSYSECVLFQRLCLPYRLISEKQTLIKLTVIPCEAYSL